jgi:hypothetical protein
MLKIKSTHQGVLLGVYVGRRMEEDGIDPGHFSVYILSQ